MTIAHDDDLLPCSGNGEDEGDALIASVVSVAQIGSNSIMRDILVNRTANKAPVRPQQIQC